LIAILNKKKKKEKDISQNRQKLKVKKTDQNLGLNTLIYFSKKSFIFIKKKM